MPKQLKLNLGCGTSKINGYLNIDVDRSVKPDVVHNFITHTLPFQRNSVREIVLFHTIEHIQKRFHKRILAECWRVLKPGGRIIISYPEFTACYNNWVFNKNGKKEFWENTIFGRQLYKSDYHVCIMHTPDFIELVKYCGFVSIDTKPEPLETYNTIVTAIKGSQPIDYETLVTDYVGRLKFEKLKRK